MASFRLNHDELQHELEWRLLQPGPVTMYVRPEYLEEDVAELSAKGYRIHRLRCSQWKSASAMWQKLREELGLEHTPSNYDALDDLLEDMDVPDVGGTVIVLDNYQAYQALGHRPDVLLDVLARASRQWLLFGRRLIVLLRTDNPDFVPPVVGATTPEWNGREWFTAARKGVNG